MKKLITLAIALVAIVSQAASIDWKVGTTRNTFIWDSTGNKFNGTAYLILADQVTTLTSGTFSDLTSALSTAALDSVSLSNGGYLVNNRTATSDSLTRLQSYTYQLLLLDTATETYALSAKLSKMAYGPDDGAQLVQFAASNVGAAGSAAASTINWMTLSGGDEPDPGPGGDDPVTPDVPEPATGALALAGLALLFRRKRA